MYSFTDSSRTHNQWYIDAKSYNSEKRGGIVISKAQNDYAPTRVI